jgi:hypothetical protein
LSQRKDDPVAARAAEEGQYLYGSITMRFSTFILIFALGLIGASALPQPLVDQEKSQNAAKKALTAVTSPLARISNWRLFAFAR